MDYMNIIEENKNLLTNSQQNLKAIADLVNFFKFHLSYYKDNAISFKNKYKIVEKDSFPVNSILYNNIQSIKKSLEKCFLNTIEISNRMEKEVILKLDEFGINQQKIYQEEINKLNNITIDFIKYYKLFDVSKKNYYKLKYIANDFNQKNERNEDKEQNERIKDGLTKLSSQIKNEEFFYKCEVERYNKQISIYNTKYLEIKKEIEENEENRIKLIKTVMENYYNILGEFIKNEEEYKNLINQLINQEVIEKDKLLFFNEINKYNKSKDNERLPKANFISFSDFLKENPEEENNIKKGEYIINDKNSIVKMKDNELKNFMNKVIDQLFNEENCLVEDYADLMEIIKNKSIECEKIFLTLLIERKKESSVQFLNLKNLELLSEILSYIMLNNSAIISKKFDLNFLIIFIGERFFYQNKKTNLKTYLSAILSKNKFFRTKSFWKNICEVKLAIKLEDYITRMKDLVLPNEKPNNFFLKLGTMIGFNEEIYDSSLLSKSRICPLIKNYRLIDATKVPLIDQMAKQEISEIIKLNIPSFSSFNVALLDSLNLISELIEQYQLSKDYLEYYKIYNNISNYTVRKYLHHENYGYLYLNDFSLEKKNIKLISFSLKYLKKKEFLNLMLLSRNISKSLSRNIYNIILKDSKTDNKLRIKLWENYLEISKLKKKYNYKEVLNSLKDEKLKNDIQKDVIRTFIKDTEKTEEIRNKLLNILWSVSELNGEIKYYQGMNYIVSFLLELTDEETSFYIFLSFFFNTDYYIIFDKDLIKLKHFFYVFKRLISLFEPELLSYLIGKSIDIQNFISPWFITLFLNSRQYNSEKDSPKILIRILDKFILNGWESLMKIGILILHSFEKEIMKMNYEEILKFLISDLLKTDFLKDGNIDLFEKCFDEKQIKNDLIKNIEKEYILEEKLFNQKKEENK